MQPVLVTSFLIFGTFAILLRMLRLLRRAPRLPGPTVASGDAGNVGVVVAARDEEKAIVSTLQSILADPGVGQVIVVDDHSLDETLGLARSMAQDDARLKVLSAPDLPEGWIGKSHALHFGSKEIDMEFILFADADVSIARGSVTAAARKMKAGNLDHLSGFFRMDCETPGEQICAPVFIWAAVLTLFADGPARGAATGAFNMIRSETYRAMGGHDRFKHTVVDDVALARTAKEHGGNSCFVDLSDAVRVRLFEGFAGCFRAIARSSQSYLGDRFLLGLGGGAGLIALGALMVLNLAISWSLILPDLRGADPYWIAAAGFATGGYGLAVASAHEIRRYYDGRLAWSLLLPVAIVIMGSAIAWSALQKLTGAQVRWRGRDYAAK
jgi:hypothetical protein